MPSSARALRTECTNRFWTGITAVLKNVVWMRRGKFRPPLRVCPNETCSNSLLMMEWIAISWEGFLTENFDTMPTPSTPFFFSIPATRATSSALIGIYSRPR